MWPISMPRSMRKGEPQRGHRSPSRDLGGGQHARRREVPPRDDVDGVLALDVRAGGPGAAVDHQRVDDVAHALEPLGADVAADQLGVLGEVAALEGHDLRGGDVGLEPLEVDLAVAGHADHQGLDPAVGVLEVHDDVLERLGRRRRRARGPCRTATSVSMVGVSGVSTTVIGPACRVRDGGRGDLDGLDVGGVVAAGAGDEGVLAGGGHGQELLRRRPAHRPADRRDDPVVHAEPVEDGDVGPRWAS